MQDLILSDKDKEVLSRAISYYYREYVWGKMASKDNAKASDEDYALRHVLNVLDLRRFLSEDILARF